MKKNKILAILGPTASGKTALCVRLAELIPAEIISCDSVQVYKYLDIGSAKPEPLILDRYPHHLISIYEPDQPVNAGMYKKAAEEAIQDCHNREILPMLSGGTGMYFNALYFGMFSLPSSDSGVRQSLLARLEAEGLESLYQELLQKDPCSQSRVMPRDKQRILRNLEVIEVTGRPLSELQQDNERLDLDWLLIGLDLPRDVLYQRINERAEQMLEAGLVEETRRLAERFGKDAPALSAIGYRHALAFLEGRWDWDTLLYELQKDTRHYAKRQLTWFRKNQAIQWFDPSEPGLIIEAVQQWRAA